MKQTYFIFAAGFLLAGCASELPLQHSAGRIEGINPPEGKFCEYRSAAKKNAGMYESSVGDIHFVGKCKQTVLHSDSMILLVMGDSSPDLMGELDYYLHPEGYYTPEEEGEIDCLPRSKCMNEKLAEASRRQERERVSQWAKGQIKRGVVVNFDKNSIEPTNAELIQGLAHVVNDEKLTIVVVGYTDSVGNNTYNEKLGMQRAERVKELLLKFGVDSERVRIESRGEQEQIAENTTQGGRARNRRVLIKEWADGNAN